MAGSFRVVFEFAESNGSGFNEVYYTDEPDPQKAAELSSRVKAARLALLHPLNTWTRVRASNIRIARETATTIVNAVGTATGNGPPLPVGAAVVLSMSGVSKGTRKLWLRGCPDSFYARDPITGRDKPSADLLKLLEAYFKALAADNYGIQKRTTISRTPGNPFYPNPILQVDGTGGQGKSVLTLLNNTAYTVPGRVVFGKVNQKELPGLQGAYDILAAQAPNLTIAYNTPSGRQILTAGGYVRQLDYTLTDVFLAKACGFDHMGTRTSRSPLPHSRGARRAKRIRLSL